MLRGSSHIPARHATSSGSMARPTPVSGALSRQSLASNVRRRVGKLGERVMGGFLSVSDTNVDVVYIA
jgi:hypothetical protein